MLPPLIQRPRPSAAKRSRERGVTLALVAVALFSIIAMAGLSIDLGTLYQASAEAQRAADAGALAAAREISVSGITGAVTPLNQTPSWQQICGGAGSIATQTAIAVARQNTIAGVPPSSTIVTYSTPGGTPNPDCSGLSGPFGVNPIVIVRVTQASLPTYFARIWGRVGSSVSATATAEAFNPSSTSTSVQPRCVKPWMVPNLDPLHAVGCTSGCTPFVNATTGNINNPGIVANGSGIIGEQFWLIPDCTAGPAACSLLVPGGTPPQANYVKPPPLATNLEYLPGQTSFASTAVTSDGSAACSDVAGNYAQAIAGCDQSTQYQCGVLNGNAADLIENPGSADTTNGVQCLIRQATPGIAALSGQDVLLPVGGPPSYPFQIQAGTSNPLGVSGAVVTSSTSIVSLPIYDSSTVTVFPTGLPTQVTIIGFLQVFINAVDATGDVNVTVLNVAGCTNNALGGPVAGSSPVPVRLITPP
ncbi:MAG: pilus assembly protein TadG-related protein [Candidatus Sulfotelmatobacter sp.]